MTVSYLTLATLPGHSLTATGNEVSCPRVSAALLFSIDEITLCAQMQMTDQSSPNCPDAERNFLLLQKLYLICVPTSVTGILKKIRIKARDPIPVQSFFIQPTSGSSISFSCPPSFLI